MAVEDQQFCLRWNDFQANFTSQFETLRDDEDFTDVTIACEGQKIQAHKVVLSACSPYFKELFKANPCTHPIIFMRDVEAQHIISLMEFMYAGEVNVAQANLSAFLKTAESLKIRGLTDASFGTGNHELPKVNEDEFHHLPRKHRTQISSSSAVTSSQDPPGAVPSPPPKKHCKSESDRKTVNCSIDSKNAVDSRFELDDGATSKIEPKIELSSYLRDDEGREEITNFLKGSYLSELPGELEIPHTSLLLKSEIPEIQNHEDSVAFQRLSSPDNSSENNWETSARSSPVWKKDGSHGLIKIGEGIEICEEKFNSIKWSDYRKLTRGLASILFSPAELASCSVTGQRWSRAGSGERPVKPALDKAKVQAIIAYVATRFPLVEISRIKQVLAYKCKENSTAFKMKSVRYYGNTLQK